MNWADCEKMHMHAHTHTHTHTQAYKVKIVWAYKPVNKPLLLMLCLLMHSLSLATGSGGKLNDFKFCCPADGVHAGTTVKGLKGVPVFEHERKKKKAIK